MKKFTIALQMLFVALIASLACSVNNESGIDITTDNNDITTLTVADFDYAGQLHNDGLSYIRGKLTELPANVTEDERAEFINEKSIEFIQGTDITGKDLILTNNKILKEISDPKSIRLDLYGYSQKEKKIISSEPEILNELSIATEKMSSSGTEILTDFYGLITKTASEEMTHGQFKTGIHRIIDKYNDTKFMSDSFEGMLLGSMLNISKQSIEWWETKYLLEDPNVMTGPMHTYDYYYMLDLEGALEAHIYFYVYQETYEFWDWTKQDFIDAGAYAALKASALVDTDPDYEHN